MNISSYSRKKEAITALLYEGLQNVAKIKYSTLYAKYRK